MKLLCLMMLTFFSTHLLAQAQLRHQLERINFFPESEAFLSAAYEHHRLNIEVPVETLNTKEVNNYYNLFGVNYAQKINRKVFLGIGLWFEQSSENAVSYGIASRRRFNGYGFKEPELFMLYRLRHQKEDRGLIDLNLSLSPSLGEREVGKNSGTRFNGRKILKTELSHGLWEEEWEFRTSLGFNYFGGGEERNAYADQSYDFDDYYIFLFRFMTQYRINPWLFAYGSAGFDYKSVEYVREKSMGKREIQAGTGSLFELGLKKPLSPWSLLELSFTLNRYEYFVKGTNDNLDGNATRQNFMLVYKYAF